MEMSLRHVPPHNIEAEQAVLSAILLENEALPKSLELLQPEHFYREAHRKIFAACIEQFEHSEPVDLLTLTEVLRRKGQLEEVGGAAYLASLLEAVPTAANVRYHAKLVKERALLRSLINVATEIVTQGYEESGDVEELLDRAERAIFEIAENQIQPGFFNIQQVIRESFKTIDQAHQHKELITGLPTGFRDLDELTAGLHPSELVIIAGRPRMGKTAFCLNIAQYVGLQAHKTVAIFSLEMSKEQLAIRMLCSEGRIDSSKLRTGYLSKEEWVDLTRAAGELSETLIYIDDSPALSVLEIRAKARRLRAEHGLDLVIVDYLQLMRGRSRVENRQQEIAEISRSLKALAKELKVPVVALSQLSRAVETRRPPRPQLSDLRESGAIEQDADVILFIYRPEVYDEGEEELGVPGGERGTAEIIIGKQRNGPIGKVKLAFKKECMRFADLYEG